MMHRGVTALDEFFDRSGDGVGSFSCLTLLTVTVRLFVAAAWNLKERT